MSYQIGLDTVNLKPTPRIAHTEYSIDFPSIMTATIGEHSDTMQDRIRFHDAWDFDLYWSCNDGKHAPWEERGRTTDMGHAEYAEDGVDKSETISCPFESAEEVLEFDAVKEYGLLDFSELVKYYEDAFQEGQAMRENQVFTGGYYRTIISGAIAAFGWNMLLTAAAEPDRFAKVLRSFGKLTLHHVKAWAETSVKVFIQHDDFVWTEGPFMRPDFYRAVIIPEYKKFWDILHKAGKKVLFCSDARFDMFMDDIVEAGADGLIFEPCNDFTTVAKKYGKTHCLIGSAVDCCTMTLYGWDRVKEEMDITLQLAPECNGLMWAVGNHIPSNVPIEICNKYLEYLRQNWHRSQS